jgi:hypothetical protein
MVRPAHSLIIGLAALAASVPALGQEATYLTCSFVSETGRELSYRLAIYPDRGIVVVTPRRTGEGVSYPATFNSTTVSVLSRRDLFGIVVSRATLQATLIDGVHSETTTTQCVIEETAQNQF